MKRTFLLVLLALIAIVSVSFGQNNRIIVLLKNDSLSQHTAVRADKAQTSNIPLALAEVVERFGNINIKRAMPHRSPTRQSNAFPFHRLYVIQVPSNQDINSILALLEKNENIEYSEQDIEISFYSDPRYNSGEQWYLHNTKGKPSIEMEHAWGIFKGDDNNIVAVLDADGVDSEHEDLQGRIFGDALGYGKSHATQVAGIIGANSLNGVGIRGIDMRAKILSRRINPTDMVGVADIIIDAVDRGASIINCSWGADYRKTLELAFRYAYDNDCVVVAAMGNNQNDQKQYPAAHPYVIAVGALNEHDIRASYSNYGNHIDVVCLGNNVLSTDINNSYNTCTGTSFSAPMVSGVASLLKGYRPELHNDDIRQIIRRSAVKLADMNGADFSPYYGYGRLNAGAALEMVKEPNSIVHGFAVGSNAGKTSVGKWIYTGDGKLPAGMYLGVERYKMTKRVVFDVPFVSPPVVWMRERDSRCFHAGNPNSGEPYAEISNITTTGFDITYYTYYVPYNSAGTSVNTWIPASLSESGIAYTAIGIKNPLYGLTLTGPTQVCTEATFTLNNLPAGATVHWNVGGGRWNALELTSGQGTAKATYRATDSGRGNVQVTVSLNGASTTLSQTVWAGAPSAELSVNGDGIARASACLRTDPLTMHAEPPVWQLWNPSQQVNFVEDDDGRCGRVRGAAGDWNIRGTVTVRNGCGEATGRFSMSGTSQTDPCPRLIEQRGSGSNLTVMYNKPIDCPVWPIRGVVDDQPIMEVYDRMGRLLLRHQGEQVSLGSLRPGLYIVRARSGEDVATLTVVR